MTESPYRAGELLQTSATISAIALALAALSMDRGPEYSGYHPLAIALLLGGFLALVGSLYAIVDMWDEVGLTSRDILRGWSGMLASFRPSSVAFHPTLAQSAMIVTTWGLIVIGIAYILLLIAAVP